MKFIGLLMVNGENDILERVLDSHTEMVDAFYVLDGTIPNTESERICRSNAKCASYITDADVIGERYGTKPRDGWRQALYEQAVEDHGYDNWFLILHGDEIWRQPPANTINGADGYWFLLPFYFPRVGEPWDYNLHPLDQLHWHLGPGYPEFRMFRGSPNIRYDEQQHSNTKPNGLASFTYAASQINHYLYRSPETQRTRARQHLNTGFDPDNYRHIISQDAVYWTDEMIARYQQQPYFEVLNA